MKFDWYAATYNASVPRELLAACRGELPIEEEEPYRAKNGYAEALHLAGAEGTRITFQWGGTHEGQVHAVATGAGAEPFAKLIRSRQADHWLTRGDVAMDFAEPGDHALLRAAFVEVTDRFGIDRQRWDDDGKGRKGETLLAGSEQSVAQGSLYQKGLQVTQKWGWLPAPFDTEETAPKIRHWVRLEGRYRPQRREARVRMASAPHEAFWGLSRWTKDLIRVVGGLNVERIAAGTVWRPGDLGRAKRALLRQYGPLLDKMLADHGSWDCVGLQLGHDLEQLREEERLRKLARVPKARQQ